MKKFTLLASLLMFITLSYAVNVIPVGDAMQASRNFLIERVGATKANQMDLTLVKTEYSAEGTPVTYRFSVGEKGFIIVSATELANPILAYSLESNFKEGIGADLYTEKYAEQISYLMKNPEAALAKRNSWSHYLASDFVPYSAAKGNPCVEPLVTTLWTQDIYYNEMCPTNPLSTYSIDSRSYVGCVALTMANILYYYRYPDHGYGIVSYIPKEYNEEHSEVIYTYPRQTVNYGQAQYDYDAIANQLYSYDGELAKLLYHCGVSVRMSYGHDGSGSQSEYAMTALQDHYFYSDLAQFRSVSDVSAEDWVAMAKAELDAHRPLFFSGQSASAGGHAWIVDGYTTINDNTYFHVNWGWAGSDNGYYTIDNMLSSGYGNFNVSGTNTMMTSLMPDSAEIAKPAESSKRVTASFGTISDGAGNMKYAQNSNRRWVIACPDATSYKFTFSKLKVKEGDKVIIYNGGTEASGIKKQYSGDYLMAACNDYSPLGDAIHAGFVGEPLPDPVSVTADSVLIVFTSTANSETDYGFVLNYEVTGINQNGCTDQTLTDGYAVLTDKPGNATGDGLYALDNVCEYTLNLRFTNQLVCAFHKFDLKQGDFVDIYNQASSTSGSKKLLAHFDADNLPAEVYTYDVNTFNYAGSPISRFIIRFVTDNKDAGTGFEFEYYAKNTGISQFDNVEVSVYPNPATSYINVEVAADEAQQFNAKVVDMMGKTVYEDQINHNGGSEMYQIPVNTFAKGVYFLHLNSTSGSHVQKFIVE